MNIKRIAFLIVFLIVSVFSFSQGNITSIQSKAESGDSQSQYYLGWCYMNGRDVKIDKAKAVYWIKQSALQGYEPAQYFLGWCYFYGEGVVKDNAQSYYWYEKSAKQGNQYALSMVRILKENPTASTSNIVVDEFDASKPPVLNIVPNSVTFVDPNGNNAIDANETCYIKFKLCNSGTGSASNCTAKVFSAEAVKGLSLPTNIIPVIKSGDTIYVSLPISSSMSTIDGTSNLFVQVDEPHGFGTDAIAMSINTRKFNEPLLQVVDSRIVSSDGSNVLKKRSSFDLQVLLQNTKQGTADNVVVSIDVPENVLLMESQRRQEKFASLNGGATKSIVYPLIVNNNYKGNTIPIKINISEKYGKYAESKIINLNLNQTLASNKIVVEEKQDKRQDFAIKIASIGSDIDKNIPSTGVENKNTFAVVIANESYNKESGVPFASNDGRVFSEYCKNTLGLPETNIHTLINATLNDIRHEVKWLQDVMGAYKGEAKAIFYYAGHGIPDEKNKDAYLLPVDGYGTDVTTGYSLDDLYKTLGGLPAKSVTVFLDACFSGAKRDGDMLASARGVAIKVKESAPTGKMVVFTAAQGDETAYPYKEQGHGLFTYYLLKKLQDSKGDVTLGELGNFVKTQVERQSVVTNGKLQTPSIIPATSVGDSWKAWKLK